MDVSTELIQPLLKYIAVTFLATEVIKQIIIKIPVNYELKNLSILVSVVIGILLSYGWTLSVLPEADKPGFEIVAVILTGLIIAGAASGLFSWAKKAFPFLEN